MASLLGGCCANAAEDAEGGSTALEGCCMAAPALVMLVYPDAACGAYPVREEEADEGMPEPETLRDELALSS